VPNRIIREGINDSNRVEALVRSVGWPGEVFYRRLLNVVDDFGRYDGRLSMLKSRCFPTLGDLVREADLQRWIAACVTAGLVRLYTSDGREYLEVLDFKQQQRAVGSKYPEPPTTSESRIADATHVHSECVADAKHMRTKTKTEALSEGEGDSATSSRTRPKPKAVGKVRAPPTGDHAELIGHFTAEWERRYGRKYPFHGGRDGEAAKFLLEQTSRGKLAEAKDLTSRYVADNYKFFVEAGHPLYLLKSNVTRYLTGADKAGGFTDLEQSAPLIETPRATARWMLGIDEPGKAHEDQNGHPNS
jgi:hypothetical protein